MLQNINSNIIRVYGLVIPLDIKFDQFRDKVENDLQMLTDSMHSLNHSISNLSTCLQEHKEQTAVELANLNMSLQEHKKQTLISINTSLISTQASIDNLTTCLLEHKQQTQTEIMNLQTSLNFHQTEHTRQLNNKLDAINSTLNSQINQSVSDITKCIQEHKQQTTAELSHLQTSLTSTHSKLDTLTNTTASDHQQITDSLPDVECMDTQQTVQLHQNLQNNVTHQLENIKYCIESQPVYTCGGTGGWRRVVYLDMTDPHTTCPSGWQFTGYSKRTCGRVSTGKNTCDSATFPVSGGQYNRICGKITAYQWGQPDAFGNTGRSIDEAYACGVSLTHGTPRNHIWTFVAGWAEGLRATSHTCPCDATVTITIPQFVGNDYFCESGINEPWDGSRHNYIFYSNDTLWDGEDCLPSSTCCSLHNPPYFVKQLPTSTTDDIEARICVDDAISATNIAVELVELYVQ